MTREEVNKKIKKTVESVLPGARVVLFGSRAKQNYTAGSDYDLLIIIPDSLPPREKITWYTRLDGAIVKAISAPVDLLLYCEAEVIEKKELPGNIVRTALKEGIFL